MNGQNSLLRNIFILVVVSLLVMVALPRFCQPVRERVAKTIKPRKTVINNYKFDVSQLELGYKKDLLWRDMWQAFKMISEENVPAPGPYKDAHEEAWAEARKENFSAALKKLEASRSANPDLANLRRDLSCLYCVFGWKDFNAHGLDEAESKFGQALVFWNGNFWAMQGQAYIYYERKDERAAEDMLIDTLAEGGTQPELYLLLGLIYWETDRLEDALEQLQYYLSLRPENREIQALVDQLLREKDVEKSFTRWDSRHFQIKYEGREDEAAALMIEEVAEGAYFDVGAEFDHYPVRPVVIVLYTNEQFQDVTHSPEWAGAVFDGKIRIPAAGMQKEDELRMIVHHEYTHALIYDVCQEGVPVWFHEGMAQTAQYKISDAWLAELSEDYDLLSKFFVDHGGPYPLSRLEGGFMGFTAEQAVMAYLESYLAVKYIEEEYGGSALSGILAALGEKQEFRQALEAVTGVTYQQFERDFETWVKEQADWSW